MIALALEPFTYQYMTRAIWVSALIGGACAFLSCFLILKGWSLMGDALAHAVVPGVALAYLVKLPYAAGAFLAGLIASFGMAVIRRQARLREDVVIGMVFTSFFAIGLVIISLNPTSVNVQTIVFGNILAISDEDVLQVIVIGAVSLGILAVKWRDLMLVFFDEVYARSIGLSPLRLQILFFALLSACTVAALQTVGAILVIAMVITPGATAYLLTDRFGRMIILAVGIGAASSAVGAYASYFLDGSTGGLIVMLQTGLFLAAFVLAPRHGLLAGRRAQRQAPAPPAAGA
ncbi:MAG: metal ABC transporter permease [Bosea sp.]|jgi:manganese/iron transport system permease protein|nr:metal ABC transporter permease [Bosea sp. (in: a-proteobacteria)]